MSQLTEYCAAALYMTRLKLNTKCSNKWNCYTCNYCYFFSVFGYRRFSSQITPGRAGWPRGVRVYPYIPSRVPKSHKNLWDFWCTILTGPLILFWLNQQCQITERSKTWFWTNQEKFFMSEWKDTLICLSDNIGMICRCHFTVSWIQFPTVTVRLRSLAVCAMCVLGWCHCDLY